REKRAGGRAPGAGMDTAPGPGSSGRRGALVHRFVAGGTFLAARGRRRESARGAARRARDRPRARLHECQSVLAARGHVPALGAFGGRDVSESQLTETLWPDAEGDAAHEACAITLHRLRKLLGHDQAISLQRNHFSLDPCYVWVDVWAFERWLAPAQGDAA